MSSPLLARSKEIREIVRTALRAGWQVVHTKNCHLKFTAPSGAIVFVGANNQHWRNVHNCKARLRREGLPL